MPFVTVKVEVDASDVVVQLDDDDLAELGLVSDGDLDDEREPIDWDAIGGAIRRGDFGKAEELITEAARASGADLPPFAVARVA